MNSDKYFNKYSTFKVEFSGKKFRASLLEMPFFRHKSEVSELGFKRHLFIKSDNRFVLKFLDKFDDRLLDSLFGNKEDFFIYQLEGENIIRKWTLKSPRLDENTSPQTYLIDCLSWTDETFDPKNKASENSKEEFEELLSDLLK